MNVGLEEAKRWQFVCVCTCVCVRGHDISHTGSLAHVSPSDSDTHAEIDKLTHTHSRRRRLGYSALHQTLNISDRLKSPRSAESLLFSPRLTSFVSCFIAPTPSISFTCAKCSIIQPLESSITLGKCQFFALKLI